MSTESQRYSLENQSAAIAAYALREGVEIVATYQDSGRSGVTMARRHGLKALLRDVVDDPPFGAVLVLDVSRWGRFQNPDEAAHYEFVCRQAGVRVKYCGEPFDDDGTVPSALLKNLKRVMAAEYSGQLSDRCRVGLRRASMAGTRAGGRVPFGFDRRVFNSDGSPGPVLEVGERRSRPDQIVRLVPGDPEQVAVLRRIFSLFTDARRGPADIARTLNAEGVQYHRGGAWNSSRIQAILTNEIATGVYAFNRSVWRFGKLEASVPKADWSRVAVVEQLISTELFERAQTRYYGRTGHWLSDADLIDQAKSLLQTHGYLSRRLIAASPVTSCVPTFIKRFGSMQALYGLAGYARSGRHGEQASKAALEPDQIIKGLQALLMAHGYLSAGLIDETPDMPHQDTIRRRFGTLDAAFALAGYSATPHEKLLIARARRKQARGRAGEGSKT